MSQDTATKETWIDNYIKNQKEDPIIETIDTHEYSQKLLKYESKSDQKTIVMDFTTKSSHYKCDGRQYCSQMTSCKEAKYFINNCPNTKMDGDRDGIPCERQWCH